MTDNFIEKYVKDKQNSPIDPSYIPSYATGFESTPQAPQQNVEQGVDSTAQPTDNPPRQNVPTFSKQPRPQRNVVEIPDSDDGDWSLWDETFGAISYGAAAGWNSTLQAVDDVTGTISGAVINTEWFQALPDNVKKTFIAEEGDVTMQDVVDFFKYDALKGGAPKTIGGNLIADITRFAAGFGLAGKALKFSAAKTGAEKVGQAMAKGAVADFAVFDPAEQNLSALIQQYPELANPVNEYLASNVKDDRTLGRLKNALEGLGLGVAMDGFVGAIKGIGKIRAAKVQNIREQAEQVKQAKIDAGEVELPGVELKGDNDVTKTIKPADGKTEPQELPPQLAVLLGELILM